MQNDFQSPIGRLRVKLCPYMSWDSKPVLGGNTLFVSREMYRTWNELSDSDFHKMVLELEVLVIPGIEEFQPSMEMLKYAIPITPVEWKT